MKILVTGALGNIGGAVARNLIENKESVVLGDISLTELEKQYPGQDSRYFDFTEPETFAGVLDGVDRVFLMRPPHLGKPEDLEPFIQALKQFGIKLVAFLSLMGVETNTRPPHHKIEKMLEANQIPYCFLRPSFFMQNLSGVHSEEIRTKDEIFIPAGKSKCSFIDTEDIGLAGSLVLRQYEQHINTKYTLTGPEALDYYEVAERMSKILNRKIRYAKPSILSFRQYMIHKRKLDKTYVNVMCALYFMTRMGAAVEVNDEFKQLTGAEPRTIDDFIEDNRAAFL